MTDPAWSAVDESAGFANVAIDLADHDFESGGYFLQYDHAIWSFSTPDSTTIGDKASERIVSVNGITYTHRNSLSTDFITRGHDRNNRWEFGHSGGRHGWLATYIRANDDQAIEATGVSFVPRDPQFLLGGYQDADEDGIDDDLDLDNIYGRSGQDLGTPDAGSPTGFSAPFDGTIDAAAPIDTGDLVLYLATFDNFVARNSVQLRGVELMGTWRLSRPESHAGGFELYYGVRFMDLKDTFSASGTGGVLGNSNWTSQVENDIWGPQLGFRWTRQHRFMRISLENRFTAGINWQRSRLTGQLATEIQNGANEPAALSSSSFNDELDDTEFTPINELRADVAFRVNHWLGLRLGYSAMLIGNMSRASHKVVYELPTFGLNDDGTRDTLFASAFTFGVELNR